MLDRWEFLVGEADVLEPIWANYFLDPPAVRMDSDRACNSSRAV